MWLVESQPVRMSNEVIWTTHTQAPSMPRGQSCPTTTSSFFQDDARGAAASWQAQSVRSLINEQSDSHSIPPSTTWSQLSISILVDDFDKHTSFFYGFICLFRYDIDAMAISLNIDQLDDLQSTVARHLSILKDNTTGYFDFRYSNFRKKIVLSKSLTFIEITLIDVRPN